MRSPLIALAASIALAAPLALATTGTADAATCTAPELVRASVTPHKFVLGTSTAKTFVVTARVRKHGCTVSRVDTDVSTPAGASNSFKLGKVSTSDGVTVYKVRVRVKPSAVRNVDAGRWTSRIRITWGSKKTNDAGGSFRLVHAAKLSANASPEPVRKGSAVTVTGTLKAADWEKRAYAGYAGQRVVLQFRAGHKSYRTLSTVTSGAGGKVLASAKATRDGCYRLVYRGSSTTEKVVSKRDCVNVH